MESNMLDVAKEIPQENIPEATPKDPPKSKARKSSEIEARSPKNSSPSTKESNMSWDQTTGQTSVISTAKDLKFDETELSRHLEAASDKESFELPKLETPELKSALHPSVEAASMEANCTSQTGTVTKDDALLLTEAIPANEPLLSPRNMINTRSTRSTRSTRQSSCLQSSGPCAHLEMKRSQEPFQQTDDMSAATRSLRKRKRDPPSEEELMRVLTEDERRNWEGWAEIESEPALFNYILRGHGVKDVKIKELIATDDEFLNMLPKPVYGIIFLYKYRDIEDETAELPKCPRNVWFANQIAANSCATVAMCNILMNVPDIDIGPALTTFKGATMNIRPPYRGRELSTWKDIRIIHNSFVRRIETLNADLYLKNEYDNWLKQKMVAASSKKRKSTPSRKKTAKQKQQEEDDDPAFHFIAYVPIGDEVWRMDGMQHNPVNLGEFKSDWLTVARENIMIQMAMHPEDLEFNFMAVCKAPLAIIRTSLAANAHAIQEIESKLASINSDWRAFLSTPGSPSPSPDYAHSPSHQSSHVHNSEHTPSPPRELADAYGLTPAIILATPLSPSVVDKLSRVGIDMEALMMLRAKLIAEEKQLQQKHCMEVMDDSDEVEKAEMHTKDFSPDIYKLIKEMFESGDLERIWDEL